MKIERRLDHHRDRPTQRIRQAVAITTTCLAAGAATASVMTGLASASVSHTATPATANVPLVVYSAQGYDKVEVAAFTKKYGIKVNLDDNSTGPLLTQIEASKNNPKWGLLWVDGATAFAGLDAQNLLLRGYEPNVPWNSLGRASLPANKSYVPTGVTLAGAMAYDTTKVTTPPSSWQSLLSSAWKGQVGTNDPTQSGPTYPFVAGMMNYLGGVGSGETFFSKLKSNGLLINPTNGPTLAALSSGQIKIALVQSSAAVGATFTDKHLKVKYLNPVTMLPSAIGIDAKASTQVKKEAKLFEQFVLSSDGQKVMQSGDPTGDSLYYPVISTVRPLPALPSLTAVKTQTIDPYIWGSRENTINAWFDTNIVR
ncbi:MAG TPA: extracellular solute-binding protein [Acidimicrobiales bacterium]|jgi:iron(III) transport system substrate-binding protein|nr:extracellular solute-binding protein [Acidimicrobiales bacterium]